MSVTVDQLYKSCKKEYGLKAIAGTGGFNSLTEWVHITEESNVIKFLRGHELVITTGVMNNTRGWLLSFVTQLFKAGASGLVVNIGPYIPEVDAAVIDYCNQNDFPLFTMPWATRIVDITRDFCTLLNQNMTFEAELSFALRGLIMHLGNENNHRLCLIGGGFKEGSPYYIVAIGMKNGEEIASELKIMVERASKSVGDFYCGFDYDNSLILLMCDYSRETLEAFVYKLKALLRGSSWEHRVMCASGSRETTLENLNRSFTRALSTYNICKKRQRDYMLYEDMDVYKLLFSVGDREAMETYYSDVLGALERYDADHGSKYTEFLKTYLDNNASPQLVSEKEFVHRNTVINHLKKIDSITGLNMFELDDKVKCKLAFAIKELL